MKLSARQKRFCEEYVVDLNSYKAGLRAGYAKKTCDAQMARLMKKKPVKDYIKKLQKVISDKTEITAIKVVEELAKVGFANIQNYINKGNSIKDIKTIPVDHAASVESIKVIETEWGNGKTKGKKTSITFRLHDKISALEKLGRHLGIFEVDNKQRTVKIKVTSSKPDGD